MSLSPPPQSIRLLERSIGLLALAAVVATALGYPLFLSDGKLKALGGIFSTLGLYGFFREQVLPILSFQFSPLVVKETALLGLTALMAVFGFGLHAARAAGLSGGGMSIVWGSRGLWLGLILLQGLLGLLFVQTPYMGLRTWLLMAVPSLAVCALCVTGISRRVWERLPVLLLLIGYILALVSLGQHLNRLGGWMPDFSGEPRNRVGSLIGHNTGLSGYLLFPMVVAAHGMLAGRGAWRLWCLGFLPLGAFVVITAQSRSAWLAFLVAGLVAAYFLRREATWARLRTLVLASMGGLAVSLTLATAFPGINPLAHNMVPLVERLRNDVFNIEQLRRETRTRVLIAGLPLVAQAPLFGHGVGQFQWVYPPAQGKFYHAYLGRTDAFTSKRTDVAHNDPLQFLIEFGLVGVGLAAGLVVALAAKIRDIRNRLEPGPDRLLISAYLSAVAGLAAQSAVDFPFHLAAHAYLTLLVLALVSTHATFGLRAPTSAGIAPAEEPLLNSSPQLRVHAAAALCSLGAAALLLPVVFRLSAVEIVSDHLHTKGNHLANALRQLPEADLHARLDFLSDARSHQRRATRLHQFHGVAYESHAVSAINVANMHLALAQRHRDEKTSHALHLEAARAAAESAITQANLSISVGELRWYFTYVIIARGYSILWSLKPDALDPRQANYARSAATAFEAADLLNPADSELLLERSRFLDATFVEQRPLAETLRRRLIDVDPAAAEIEFFDPIRRQLWNRNYAEAEAGWKSLTERFGNHWRTALLGVELAWWQAVVQDGPVEGATFDVQRRGALLQEADRRLQAAVAARGRETPETAYWAMVLAAGRGEWGAALQQERLALRGRTVQREAQLLARMIRRFEKGGPTALLDMQTDIGPVAGWTEAYARHLMFTFGDPFFGAALLAQQAPGVASVDPPDGFYAMELLQRAGNEGLAGLLAQALLRNRRLDNAKRDELRPLAAKGKLAPEEVRPVPESALPPRPAWPGQAARANP